jgi:hypothetical protein
MRHAILFKYFDKILNKTGNNPIKMFHLKDNTLFTNNL